jgi:hypothetical protein
MKITENSKVRGQFKIKLKTNVMRTNVVRSKVNAPCSKNGQDETLTQAYLKTLFVTIKWTHETAAISTEIDNFNPKFFPKKLSTK